MAGYSIGMKICVFGAGAVGGHIAARLAAKGHDVSVVARGAHLAAIEKNGLRLHHGEELISGRVRTANPGPQDFVIVALKANLLDTFADAAAPLLGPETAVVFAQNGIPWWYGSNAKAPDLSMLDPEKKLAKTIDPKRVIGAVVYSANEVIEPGVIMNHVPGNNMLVVGEADDRDSPRISNLRKILEESGMSSPPAPDIRAVIWSKLIQNLATAPLSTLTEATVAQVRADTGLSNISKKIAEEGRAIAQAYGINLALAPQRPAGGQSSGMTHHKPSLLQDYERGRPMEIASLLLMPLAFAREAKVPAATLETVVALVAYRAAAKGLFRPAA
jgi:2-dehydropantoate 2-reductase